MAEPTKGIKDKKEWDACFIEYEAECVDATNTLDELFDESTDGSDVSNLIDDSAVEQGNSLALFNVHITDECDKAVTLLKRKYVKSPKGSTIADISPRLEAIAISPEKERLSKRRLVFEDSGIVEDEAENHNVQVVTQEGENGGDTCAAETVPNFIRQLFKSNCKRSFLLNKFQNILGIPYTELVRHFKSNKTCCDNWIVFAFAVNEEILQSSKILLQQHCECLQITLQPFCGLYLLQFKHAKSRETVGNLFCNILNVEECQLMCDPPKSRSVPAALYFYKRSITETSFVFNKLPAWVTQLTLISHQTAAQPENFELSKMIQWAYDNKKVDESEVAYGYASIADEDSNAAAFLKSNCQVKYVRDCCNMVRLYLRQEMRDMTVSQWIWKCCNDCEGEGDWKIVNNYLKYQQVNIISFLSILRQFFKGIPKKNCLVIYGPPDTGKSYFCYSLISFFKGKIISYMNKSSTFWLQPLIDAKFGLLDDATHAAWRYIDENMRNVLDGNVMCVDAKHKAPQQLHLPPLIVTTNVDVLADVSLKYLHSRITCIKFDQKMLFDDNGDPFYKFTNAVWKSFFKRLWKQLDLEEEENEPAGSHRTFKCTAECPE
ncbi:E1 protein [Human papillomavirus type 216]|uniref:Replication protein E1 n=1 Tax=Human papillomavirus type 216 TaxID=2060140 RepID=A0A2H4V8F0_9PAPI|nr:E1 protein [Human papillomavirus type 216]